MVNIGEKVLIFDAKTVEEQQKFDERGLKVEEERWEKGSEIQKAMEII